MKELRLSLQELILEDNPDSITRMEVEESDKVEEVPWNPPISGCAKGDSTPGRIARRIKKSTKGRTPGDLEVTPQIDGIKSSQRKSQKT